MTNTNLIPASLLARKAVVYDLEPSAADWELAKTWT